MLFNILYYEQLQKAKTMKLNNGLSLGPLYISREEVFYEYLHVFEYFFVVLDRHWRNSRNFVIHSQSIAGTILSKNTATK